MGKRLPLKEFKKANTILEPIIKNLKDKFNRPRPKQLGDIMGFDIKVIETGTHHTPAYPSGHTAYAAIAAYLFADMYPYYSSEFFKMIGLAGFARCLQGVHYPSDNEASMVITGAVWQDIRYKLFPELEPYRSKVMPIPSKKDGEDKSAFMSRCMSQLSDEYKDDKQRAAICLSKATEV